MSFPRQASINGWRRHLWATWWTAALIGAAYVAFDVWHLQLDAVDETTFRATWLYRWGGVGVWWLLLPLIMAWRRWLAFDRRAWWLILLGHLAAALAAGFVQFGFRALLVLAANTLPFAFFAEVARDLWAGTDLAYSMLVYAAIVVPAYAMEFYLGWRAGQREAAELTLAKAELETRLVRANLDALKMQLHPHFLFNALNSITALIRRGDTVPAEDALAQLAELLRRALDHKQDQKLTLERELEFLDHYFAIERIRFQDRLQVSFEVAPECRVALLPSLLLQPLVENAMKHGFSRSATARALRLRAWREDDRLRLELFNEGPPLPAAPSSSPGGIGLRNTRARLEMLFGAAARLSLENVPGGVCADVTLPFQTAES